MFYVMACNPVNYLYNGKEVFYVEVTLQDEEGNVTFARYYGKEPVQKGDYLNARVYIKKDHTLGIKIEKGEN